MFLLFSIIFHTSTRENKTVKLTTMFNWILFLFLCAKYYPTNIKQGYKKHIYSNSSQVLVALVIICLLCQSIRILFTISYIEILVDLFINYVSFLAWFALWQRSTDLGLLSSCYMFINQSHHTFQCSSNTIARNTNQKDWKCPRISISTAVGGRLSWTASTPPPRSSAVAPIAPFRRRRSCRSRSRFRSPRYRRQLAAMQTRRISWATWRPPF